MGPSLLALSGAAKSYAAVSSCRMRYATQASMREMLFAGEADDGSPQDAQLARTNGTHLLCSLARCCTDRGTGVRMLH